MTEVRFLYSVDSEDAQEAITASDQHYPHWTRCVDIYTSFLNYLTQLW